MKDLLRTEHLSRADVELLLSTAAEFAENPLRSQTALANKTVAIYMTKPSTRTRLASETAVAHLGGTPIFIRGDELQLGRGETIADTARVLSRYVDAIMVRMLDHAKVRELAEYATVPVINGLTKLSHPCQVMADILTYEEHRGSIKGKKVAWMGDANNVLASWVHRFRPTQGRDPALFRRDVDQTIGHFRAARQPFGWQPTEGRHCTMARHQGRHLPVRRAVRRPRRPRPQRAARLASQTARRNPRHQRLCHPRSRRSAIHE